MIIERKGNSRRDNTSDCCRIFSRFRDSTLVADCGSRQIECKSGRVSRQEYRPA